MTPSLDNLLLVMAVAFAAPLVLGLFPRLQLPSVVLEIVAGIVIGPSVLGWVEVDQAVEVVALIGLAFVLFLAGLEIEFEKLRGPLLRLTAAGFALSFAIALAVSLLLSAGGLVDTPLLVAIILCATSLGVLVPVLKDAGEIASTFGQLIIAAASIADFGAIILLSLFFSGEGGTGSTLLLLGSLFALRPWSCSRSSRRGALDADPRRPAAPAGHDRADPRARRARAVRRLRRRRRGARARGHPRRVHRGRDRLARRPRPGDDPPGLPAQAGGDRLRLLHPGLLRLQRRALRPRRAHRARPRACVMVPVFLAALVVVRGLPAAALPPPSRRRARRRSPGCMQATSLPFIVAATAIGQELGLIDAAGSAALIGAGLLSVLLFPLVASPTAQENPMAQPARPSAGAPRARTFPVA